MEYLECTFKFSFPNEAFQDVFSQDLADIGFDSFVADENGMQAFIQKNLFKKIKLESLIKEFKGLGSIEYEMKELPFENWNAEWEKNFSAIAVDKKCLIRATFHDSDPSFEKEIIIDPKMSFGTGHHETTYQMVQYLFELDLKNKTVMDMGCGTGILAILAELQGAKRVVGVDIDPICVENTKENIALNNVKHIFVYEGTAESMGKESFDIIIANINRNILLNDIHVYAKCMNQKGVLLLSGFYTEDLAAIALECEKNNFKFINHKTKNNWVAARFELN